MAAKTKASKRRPVRKLKRAGPASGGRAPGGPAKKGKKPKRPLPWIPRRKRTPTT